jgi:dihydrolipoamide dehydrogenase
MPERREIVIIGGGPGGYVAALRAAQLKKKVTLVEEDRIGGTCMNYGCIPTKFLLHQTQTFNELKRSPRIEGISETAHLNWNRVQEEKRNVVGRLVNGTEFLLERNGVEVLRGRAALKADRVVVIRMADGEKTLEPQKIILAMGSRSSELPFLKINGKEVITHREALDLEAVPKTMVVVGAGAIGLEIGVIFARVGTEVTVLEIMPAILPGMDKQMAVRLERMLKKQGLKIFTGMQIDEVVLGSGLVRVKGVNIKTRSGFEHAAEKVLMAAGRRPNSEILAEDYGPLLDRFGFVHVNPRLETQAPGIYAVGDLIGGKLLAHKAEHEGIIAAENAAGVGREMDYRALPMAVFTEPEFASVGLTEEEAKAQGIKARTGFFSLQANGRAVTMERPEGVVKLVVSPEDKVIGGHILSPHASELIAEITLAVKHGLTVKDVASTIHVHPTLSEAVMEAALKADGMAIHALNES